MSFIWLKKKNKRVDFMLELTAYNLKETNFSSCFFHIVKGKKKNYYAYFNDDFPSCNVTIIKKTLNDALPSIPRLTLSSIVKDIVPKIQENYKKTRIQTTEDLAKIDLEGQLFLFSANQIFVISSGLSVAEMDFYDNDEIPRLKYLFSQMPGKGEIEKMENLLRFSFNTNYTLYTAPITPVLIGSTDKNDMSMLLMPDTKGDGLVRKAVKKEDFIWQ